MSGKSERVGFGRIKEIIFHPYSAFDVAVKNKYKDDKFIYLCVARKFAIENEWKIMPIHPLSQEDFQVYDYQEGYNKIDWDTMMETNRKDDYAKHVKMAECLTEENISVNCFKCIYVESEEVKDEVLRILKKIV